MDIDILLILQEFRNSIGDALTPFMEWLSLFAVTYLPVVPALIYWTSSKKKGLFPLASYYLCVSFNALVKLTACVYRPWIRDDRVLPAGDAIRTATGYSFPSGHTATAGPIYGGMAVVSRKKYKWLSYFLIFLIMLTGFSRLYLGVHTPQDVLFALAEAALSLLAMSKIFDYLEVHPEKENMFLLAGFVIGWLGIIYITFKPYPMTYVDGQLLVDPQRMMRDGYGDIGMLIAFCTARYVEKTWIHFKPCGLNSAKGIITAICGVLPMIVILEYLGDPLTVVLGSLWGKFMTNFIEVFYIIALYPLVIRLISGTETEKPE
jgi:membrane-associated phospholipid phosphatase